MSRWNEHGGSTGPNWLVDALGRVLGYRDKNNNDYQLASQSIGAGAESVSPGTQLPPGGGVTRKYWGAVADQAAMVALVAVVGDWCTRTDLAGQVFELTVLPASSSGNWVSYPNSGGGAVTDGNKGSLTVSGTGTVWTINAAAVSLAMMANLAQDLVIGRVSASTGVPETFTVTAAARTMLDDTTVAAIVNTIGGSASTGSGGLVRETAPTLSNPVVGTQTANDNSTKAASTAYADAKVQNSAGASTTIAQSSTQTNTLLAAKEDLAQVEASIASATTTDLATTASRTVNVTGTTPITGLGTVASGVRKVLRFSGILTLTHNGTSLICPGAANITTAANGAALVQSLGSGNWRVLFYVPPSIAAGSGDVVGPASSTSGRLAVYSGTTGKLIAESTLTGVLKATSGVPAAAVEGTDYYGPSGTDIPVVDGGTGRSTNTTAYGLIAAGTTATGPMQTLPAGLTTEVMVGGGVSALPVWTTATGSGAPVRATSPTITGLTITGIFSRDGADRIVATAMGALAIDVAKQNNTKSIAVDSTFTFSGTPTTGDVFGCTFSNTDSAAHVITMPSNVIDYNTGVTGTNPWLLGAGAKRKLWLEYDGTNYVMYGSTSVAPRQSVDVSANKTFALTDAGVQQRHPAADTTGRTWTIPANGSVAFPVGTMIPLPNEQGAGAISLAITTDTLMLSGSPSTTGTRTLATGAFGILVKTAPTVWMVGGPGVS